MSELVEPPEPCLASFLADIKTKFVECEHLHRDHLANAMKIMEDNFHELLSDG